MGVSGRSDFLTYLKTKLLQTLATIKTDLIAVNKMLLLQILKSKILYYCKIYLRNIWASNH